LKEADGISDGIAPTDHQETVSVRVFSKEAGDVSPRCSNEIRQLPSMIFGIVDGIDAA
jgi:hypothetical protein